METRESQNRRRPLKGAKAYWEDDWSDEDVMEDERPRLPPPPLPLSSPTPPPRQRLSENEDPEQRDSAISSEKRMRDENRRYIEAVEGINQRG